MKGPVTEERGGWPICELAVIILEDLCVRVLQDGRWVRCLGLPVFGTTSPPGYQSCDD